MKKKLNREQRYMKNKHLAVKLSVYDIRNNLVYDKCVKSYDDVADALDEVKKIDDVLLDYCTIDLYRKSHDDSGIVYIYQKTLVRGKYQPTSIKEAVIRANEKYYATMDKCYYE